MLVFHEAGKRPAMGWMKRVAGLARRHRQGHWHDTCGGYHS
jgi:hypothetical protein